MWSHLALAAFLAFFLQAPSEPRLAASPRDVEAARKAAEHAVLDFLSTWRSAWLATVATRDLKHPEIRLRDVHCHWDGSFGGSGAHGSYMPPTLIHHSSRRSMCPNWYPADEPQPDDERTAHDVSLDADWRERVHDARARLLDSLAVLDRIAPADAWITGQRVRFLVDQGDVQQALRIATQCTAGRAWCAELSGLVLVAAGEFSRADSAFDAAAAAMSPKASCEFTSAARLLDPDGRSGYEHMSCNERRAIDERLWWLATPLLSDSLNDRRSTHLARKVLVQLHAALPWDERYDWRDDFGGEAVSDMLVRYGWPAFSAWGGTEEESAHAAWMGFNDSTRTATAEYPQDRLHLVPAWGAILDPFRAPADAWQVSMPPLTPDDEPAVQWWPVEHYARAAGPIVQLTSQSVLLRRDDDDLIAAASDLPGGHDLDGLSSVVVRSTGPGHAERVPHEKFRNAARLVVTAHVPVQPAIIGVELPAAKVGELSARTRFGVAPPPPLAALVPGETAISQPVLLAVTDGPPPGPEAALPLMLGSLHVHGAKVGIYWETYGYAPGDSVDVGVVIIRHEPLSKARRLGMLLHMAHDPNGSVAVRWQEPQAGHDAYAIPARVPIQARSVRLDLSRIEPGHYIVQVVVAKKGTGLPVVASREFIYDGM